MEDVGIFNDHLVYIMALWYILLPFGTFSTFGYTYILYQETSGNPGEGADKSG
jgi:hypothetical protein